MGAKHTSARSLFRFWRAKRLESDRFARQNVEGPTGCLGRVRRYSVILSGPRPLLFFPWIFRNVAN